MNIRPKSPLLNPQLQRPSALDSIPRKQDRLWLDKNENLDGDLLALSARIHLETANSVLNTYPEAGECYRRLADWVGVDPAQLLLTPGSDGVIRAVFEAFVEAGDAVVHTEPTFAMYPVYCLMFGADAHAVEYSRHGPGPALDLDEVFAIIRGRKPKLVCLPNPDSPTGTVVPEAQLERLLNACEDAGAVLLLDEAYHPFYPWTAVPWTIRSPNLVVARTFAKAWGVAGLRIGYAVGHPDTIALLHKMRPMYEVSTIAVEFMSRMIQHSDDMLAAVDRINEGKTHFLRRMSALGFDVLRTEGNFLHVAFGERGEAIHSALEPRVYYRKGFSQNGLKGYSRFTAAPVPIMSEVAEIIERAAKNHE